jgi:hypothetical protein
VSNHNLFVIIAAGQRCSLLPGVAELVERMGVEYVVCQDVYDAVGELATAEADRAVVVVGGFEELSREGMRLFEICRLRKQTRCCCIFGNGREMASGRFFTAIRAGVFLARGLDEFGRMVEQLAANEREVADLSKMLKKGGNGPAKSNVSMKQGGVLSRAEIEALLGAG